MIFSEAGPSTAFQPQSPTCGKPAPTWHAGPATARPMFPGAQPGMGAGDRGTTEPVTPREWTPISEPILSAVPLTPALFDPTFLYTVFVGTTTLVLITAAVCMALGSRWNRRNDRPNWKQRELAAQAPPRTERRRVRPYIRSGETAPAPELARLTVATARELLRVWENPWLPYGHVLFVAAMLLNLGQMILIGNASTGVLYVFLPPLAVFAVYYPLKRRRILPQARRAVEANEALAARAPEPPPLSGPDGWEQFRKPY